MSAVAWLASIDEMGVERRSVVENTGAGIGVPTYSCGNVGRDEPRDAICRRFLSDHELVRESFPGVDVTNMASKTSVDIGDDALVL